MDAQPTAAAAGTIDVGGDLTVNRLGFGAMRITGRGIWGDPPSRDEAMATLRRAVELGRQLHRHRRLLRARGQRELIAEALHPYPDDLVIATKGGLSRPGPNRWDGRRPAGAPARGVRGQPAPAPARADPAVPVPPARPGGAAGRVDRRARRAEGRGQDPPHRRVQRVTRTQLRQAQRIVPIVSIQNRYNVDRPQVRVAGRPVRAGAAGVPAVGADPGVRTESGRGRGRRAARRHPAPGRAGLAAGPVAGDPAHPGHRLGRRTSRRTSPPPPSS